ncbi:class I adenylate cyclase [Alteromonas sp. ASW11-130]|uniref:class I adenylate cyclase n=1 Tax=Alteromonas sp. ASW11-130 TaxID=3015775 RepID=UPI002241D07A|nr:class I adenylate cyclase [Alteromonas sp. ASW11-130]MCW8090387.1 class I adenylate cyclase [Alteromonas sp. ASW11-130]
MASQQTLTVNQNLTIRLLRVLRYNKARIERSLSLLSEEHRPLFHVLPFLLHVNHPDLPGYIENENTPFGLNNYSYRDQIKNALCEVFPTLHGRFDDIRQLWPRKRAIDALVLMGSIGTIAQSTDSDFDYWVCISGNSLSSEAQVLLQTKLTAIEQWAEAEYGIEIHFFLSDINRVKACDFGVAEGESAGSAQAVLLKAEFYTTNIVVAGKAPFWWLVPETFSEQQYYSLMDQLNEGGSPDPNWFMDLGHLEKLDPNELFGAAIWQLGKAMDSPFKSVLKMAKLEVFLENLEHEQPLCNLLKKRVHNGDDAPGSVAVIDPYALMFDQLIQHYESKEQYEVVTLLRECLYIKCAPRLSYPVREGQATFKRRILAGYAKQWGWIKSEIRHLDNLDEWSFQELVQLSRRIHRFLIQCYRRMSGKLAKEHQLVSKEDMTVIGRRLDTFYSKKEHKVAFLRSGFDNRVYCPKVTLKLAKKRNNKKVWSAYSGDLLGQHGEVLDETKMIQFSCPVRLFMWGVSNRIVNNDTQIFLDYDTDPITEFDAQNLIKHTLDLFPPVKINALPREDLLAPQHIKKCMVILNFTTSRAKVTVEEVLVAYSTTWGETYIVEGFEALDALWYELQETAPRPPCYVFVPESKHKKYIFDRFVEKTELAFTLLD